MNATYWKKLGESLEGEGFDVEVEGMSIDGELRQSVPPDIGNQDITTIMDVKPVVKANFNFNVTLEQEREYRTQEEGESIIAMKLNKLEEWDKKSRCDFSPAMGWSGIEVNCSITKELDGNDANLDYNALRTTIHFTMDRMMKEIFKIWKE